ncbi:hypothetical protein [Salinibacter phage 5_12]|jgi:hypothetical protein
MIDGRPDLETAWQHGFEWATEDGHAEARYTEAVRDACFVAKHRYLLRARARAFVQGAGFYIRHRN